MRAPEAGRVLMPAAVLIAVSDEPEPQLLLTRRSDKLTRHAGQIAFPGGRIDPEDDGAGGGGAARGRGGGGA